MTLKDDKLHLTAPANVIYQYEVQVKGVDTMTMSCPGYSPYQVEDCVWVKELWSQCTTKFGRGQVTKIVSKYGGRNALSHEGSAPMLQSHHVRGRF